MSNKITATFSQKPTIEEYAARREQADQQRSRLVYLHESSGSPLSAYALCGIEYMLFNVDGAHDAFKGASKAWGLEGNHGPLKWIREHQTQAVAYHRKYLEALQNGSERPQKPVPPELLEMTLDNADYNRLEQFHRDFINGYFNTETNIKYSTLKINYDSVDCENLKFALTAMTLADYLGVADYQSWRCYKSHNHDGKEINLDAIMSGPRPTLRAERDIRQAVNAGLRDNGFGKLPYKTDKIMEDIEDWYGCRVNPGTQEDYLNKVEKTRWLDQPNLSLKIEIVDLAFGFPRSRQKKN